ncbi:PIN domain-containing protein [Nostoc sp. TCL26-01]|uniref:PIN domain-containing protein n=1 Tax=Nostoc sp. TCL26-01 TaxID=2576904 RepID=UPI0015B7A4BB|nr:PIN domain-containing protein [Nostoc sp. TCL26-01]QLE56664.1 PIN domain-containing protein [Nostoc sp. TCL26-01]
MSRVVLDACVLFPMYLRDTLLSTAEAGLYLPYWSQRILDEAMRNLVLRGKISVEGASNLELVIKTAFPEAMIAAVPWELETSMTNNPKDRHVLATGIITNADTIVTHNLRDFSDEALNLYKIKAQSPDSFLSDLFDEYPDKIVQVIQKQAQNYKRSPQTCVQLLERLSKQIPTFTSKVLSYDSKI